MANKTAKYEQPKAQKGCTTRRLLCCDWSIWRRVSVSMRVSDNMHAHSFRETVLLIGLLVI